MTPRTSLGRIRSLSGANLHQTHHYGRFTTSNDDFWNPRILSESVVFLFVEKSLSEVSFSRASAMVSGSRTA